MSAYPEIVEFLGHHNLTPESVSPIGTGKFNHSYSVRLHNQAEFGKKSVEKVLLRVAPPPDAGGGRRWGLCRRGA